MSVPQFVLYSSEGISESFLGENENQNTLRKTRQDISLFKFFFGRKGVVIQKPEEYSPEELNLAQFVFIFV